MMKFPTLYTISVVKHKNSISQPLSSSLCIDKLISSVCIPGISWTITSQLSNTTIVRETNPDIFPYYMIHEVNFIL